jgi:hypothetical protein
MNMPNHSQTRVPTSPPFWKGTHVVISLFIAITVPLGVLAAVLVLMRIAMRQERARWLSNEAPTRIAAVARIISGLYVHMPERYADADYLSVRTTDHPHDSSTGRPQDSGASHDTTR